MISNLHPIQIKLIKIIQENNFTERELAEKLNL
jgi:hypothetical protein